MLTFEILVIILFAWLIPSKDGMFDRESFVKSGESGFKLMSVGVLGTYTLLIIYLVVFLIIDFVNFFDKHMLCVICGYPLCC